MLHTVPKLCYGINKTVGCLFLKPVGHAGNTGILALTKFQKSLLICYLAAIREIKTVWCGMNNV